uniref:THAP-type domain-containing protein n=1 Tax=Anopheles maculatus TaxID=74869 RepID=A0A182SGN7_9DIPT
MRNCYVYKCDRQHKDDPKRTMFNVPKDPQKFEEWRQALPNHRPLQPHDRVCEKHFKTTDIQRDWTYQIEGKTKKLMRTKPVLRPDAIPCIFNVMKPDDETVTTGKKRRKKSPERSEEDIILLVESTSQRPAEEPVEREQQSVVILMEESELMDVNKRDESGVVELLAADMDVVEKESIFGELYDNIFEVELPSTLWGVHREPDRAFVAFSRFGWCPKDGNATSTVSLLIDCSLECRAWYDGKLALGKDLTTQLATFRSDEKGNPVQLNMSIVTKLLDNLEQYAAREELVDVAKVKESLEDCLRGEPVEESSNMPSTNDGTSRDEGSISNKEQE